MQFTKEFFEKHPLNEEYNKKLKTFHLINLCIHAALLLVAVLFLFVRLDVTGIRLLDIKYFFQNFIEKDLLAIPDYQEPIVLYFILPFLFILGEVFNVLLLCNARKKDKTIAIYALDKKPVIWTNAIIRLFVVATVLIVFLNRTAIAQLHFFSAHYIIYIIAGAIASAVMYFLYSITARKFVLAAVNSYYADGATDSKGESGMQIKEINRQLAKDYAGSGMLAKRKGTLLKYLITTHRFHSNGFNAVAAAFAIVCIISQIFHPMGSTFSKVLKFPTQLGVEPYEIGLPLTKEMILIDSKTYREQITYTEYSFAYKYYNARIEELEEEIEEARADFRRLPTSKLTAEAIKKHDKKLAKIQERIVRSKELLKKIKRPKVTVVMDAREEKGNIWYEITAMEYDADINNGKKVAKSIKLSKTAFSSRQELAEEKIEALITYKDGSKKISYVTFSNLNDFDVNEKGELVLKWSDKWGEYEKAVAVS